MFLLGAWLAIANDSIRPQVCELHLNVVSSRHKCRGHGCLEWWLLENASNRFDIHRYFGDPLYNAEIQNNLPAGNSPILRNVEVHGVGGNSRKVRNAVDGRIRPGNQAVEFDLRWRVPIRRKVHLPGSLDCHLLPADRTWEGSRSKRSASAAACWRVAFHSGVIQTSRFSKNCGVSRLPSNIYMPAMPGRFIESKSTVMPS